VKAVYRQSEEGNEYDENNIRDWLFAGSQDWVCHTLIVAIQTIHNADKPYNRAGQAQNDSRYDHPGAGIEPPIEQVTYEDTAEDV
jgi:hypothetical protein